MKSIAFARSARQALVCAALLCLPAAWACDDASPQSAADAGPDVSNDYEDATSGAGDTSVPDDDADATDGRFVGDPLAMPNALGAGGFAMLPWPADQYMAVDGDGRPQLSPDAALLPPGFTPQLLAGSGASRVAPIVTWLPGGVDPATLPDPDAWGATLEPESAVRVVVLRDGAEPEAWPVLAEIDATVRDGSEAPLILRAHRPFPAGARVVVGLRTSLRTFGCSTGDAETCRAHEPLPALARVLDAAPADAAEQAWVERGRDALLAALPLLADDRSELVQAWSFTVRGKEEVVDPLVAMQRIAAEADSSSYTLEPVQYEDDRALVYGTLDVPWFLDADDRLVLDDDGMPQVQEVRAVPFLVTIPRTVTGPRPVVLFGHGFFSAIEEPTWSNLFDGLAGWQMAAITTRFHGFAEVDFPKAVTALSGETFDGLAGIIDLQRQSQANFTVVHNLVRDHLADALTLRFDDGDDVFAPLDGTQIPYMGISNGGTQGLVMMSTSPVLTRGALVVPGGGWAHMLQRASQWKTLGRLLSNRYRTNPAELQLATAMLQQLFDPVDSLNFVEHLVDDRLPGLPAAPEILLVEALHDAQVANMVTRWIAGAAGVPLLVPSVAEVWGVPTVDANLAEGAPGGVGYEIYDLGVPANPPGNLPATENGVHDDVRRLDAYRDQLKIFLEEGRVVRTCQGVCDPQ